MSRYKFTNNDLVVHGFILLRALLLAGFFSLAYLFWQLGNLFTLASVIVYWFYCALWNTWGWAGIGHELIHNSPFKSKIRNNIYLWATSFLSLSNRHLFFVTHFSHHKSPHGIEDFESPYILSNAEHKHRFVSIVNNVIDFRKFFNFWRYLFLNCLRVIPSPKLVVFLKKIKKFDIVVSNARLIFFYVLLVILVGSLLDCLWLLFALLIPNFVATGLVKSLALLQHPTTKLLKAVGITEIEFKNESFPVTNFNDEFIRDRLDMYIPRWLSFFYANMNYHASHHIRMTIPFFQLPKHSESNVQEGYVGLVSLRNPQILKLFFRAH